MCIKSHKDNIDYEEETGVQGSVRFTGSTRRTSRTLFFSLLFLASSHFLSYFPPLSTHPNMYSSTTFRPHLPHFLSCSSDTKPKLIKISDTTTTTTTQVVNIPTTNNTKTRLPFRTTQTLRHRLELLASEFRSLPEPIDRVRRLLDYAAVLPELDEAARVQNNKVSGCTTQVWLEAVMDEEGRMRFRADSDSEITKGFCSCLIMVLDGAEPEEVMEVKTEDLTEMNVGVHGKAVSRVNTWQNVLVGMQKRTQYLVMEKEDANLKFLT